MSRVQSRVDASKLPIVDNDVVWNYTLNDFEVGGHDEQESSIGKQKFGGCSHGNTYHNKCKKCLMFHVIENVI
jgi:hypothetical protein